jgi:hypothetical protein
MGAAPEGDTVTEAEWLVCNSPVAILTFLRRRVPERKVRLFAAACCRRIWDRLPHPCNRDLVAAIEDHPDGNFHDPELYAAIVASSARERECQDHPAYWVVKYLGRGFYKMTAEESAAAVVVKVMCLATDKRKKGVEAGLQAALLRDIVGNPFRPPPLIGDAVRAWNDRFIPKLAQAMYDDRRFDDLPILADALEVAGCTDAELLTHLRSPGPHVRGCFAVDLLLGKS